MKRFVFLLLPLATLSGCIGGDDDEPVDPTADPGSAVPGAGSTGNNATNASAPALTWAEETREGAITSAGVPGLVATNVPGSDTIQTFSIANGTTMLALNVTADGGELEVLVGEPGCEPNSGCEERLTTSGAALAWTKSSPDSGEWMVRFFLGAPGASQISYALVIAQQSPAG